MFFFAQAFVNNAVECVSTSVVKLGSKHRRPSVCGCKHSCTFLDKFLCLLTAYFCTLILIAHRFTVFLWHVWSYCTFKMSQQYDDEWITCTMLNVRRRWIFLFCNPVCHLFFFVCNMLDFFSFQQFKFFLVNNLSLKDTLHIITIVTEIMAMMWLDSIQLT